MRGKNKYFAWYFLQNRRFQCFTKRHRKWRAKGFSTALRHNLRAPREQLKRNDLTRTAILTLLVYAASPAGPWAPWAIWEGGRLGGMGPLGPWGPLGYFRSHFEWMAISSGWLLRVDGSFAGNMPGTQIPKIPNRTQIDLLHLLKGHGIRPARIPKCQIGPWKCMFVAILGLVDFWVPSDFQSGSQAGTCRK